MAHYGGTAQLATAGSKPMLVLTGDGNVLPEIELINVGFSSVPADNQYLFALYEVSDAGVGGTAITPKPIGPGATAASTLKKGTYTTDPTKTGGPMVTIPVYQRSAAKVQKAFGEGYKPAALAAAKGLGLWCDTSPAANNGEYTLNWWE